ncbi:anthranilate synthase component I [Shouchella shacheensis]|uniref:anthranilate synthase component I n=1 Tax=Shouchella shacheensis TaxID=1649580 RepID=UPI000740075B|nr:anthranilate synthase component I [Shouchella shacheensis]
MKETSYESFSVSYSAYRTSFYVEHVFADGLTPIQIFQTFEREAAFILESGDAESEWANYSFIGLTPKYEFMEKDGRYAATVCHTGEELVSGTTFEQTLAETFEIINPEPTEGQIPFRGGAVGFMSYDAIETIEPTLARGRENTVPHYHFLFCETLLAYEHKSKKLTVIHLVTNDQKRAKEAFYAAKDKVAQLLERLEQPEATGLTRMTEGPKKQAVVDSTYTKEAYMRDVRAIQEYIRAGDIFQAVLSQRFTVPVRVSGLQLYRVLRYINPSPYMFYLRIGGREVVGSSPEKLVQVNGRHVEIHPIAGTRKRGATETEDALLEEELLADDKEQAEHHMLVDLARNDVGRVATYGTVSVPTLAEIGKFSHVMHIVSKVTGGLAEGYTAYDALAAAFPAGTLSGAPKIRAMEILQELEPTRRGLYGGAIAYLGFDGNLDSCIAIRTMVVENNKAHIQAGAGIVADSVPELEYEETRSKARALIHAIEVAEEMFATEEVGRP